MYIPGTRLLLGVGMPGLVPGPFPGEWVGMPGTPQVHPLEGTPRWKVHPQKVHPQY